MFKYTDLTAKEKKHLCNGAGRKGWQGYLVPEFVFTEASNEHDFDFWQGCTQEDLDNANDRYMGRLLRSATYRENGKRRNIFSMLFLRRMALIYYNAVTVAGGSRSLGGFHFAEKKRTHMALLHQMAIAEGL